MYTPILIIKYNAFNSTALLLIRFVKICNKIRLIINIKNILTFILFFRIRRKFPARLINKYEDDINNALNATNSKLTASKSMVSSKIIINITRSLPFNS